MGGGKGGSKKVTVGYKYHMTIHFALCMGSIDELQEIRIGDRPVWRGKILGSGSAYIEQLNIFGGHKRQGGVCGFADVMAGESFAVPHPTLVRSIADMLEQEPEETDVPAYKGFTSVFFRCKDVQSDFTQTPWLVADDGVLDTYRKPGSLGVLDQNILKTNTFYGAQDRKRRGFYWSAMNPYLKIPTFKVRRRFRSWYNERADIGNDANPIHIIYECLTNVEWGLGYPPSDINDTNFRLAADTTFNENFGLSLIWDKQVSVEEFIGLILDHIDGNLVESRSTGQWEMRLVRDDYDISSLPLFDESNSKLENFNRKTLSDTVNEVVVSYTLPESGDSDTTTAQDIANFVNQGRINSQKIDYPGITSSSLASKVAQRDLQVLSKALSSVTILANRDAYNLYPGDPIRFNWDNLGFDGVVFRVTKVSLGNIDTNQIRVEAVEDSFGLPSEAYTNDSLSHWVSPQSVAEVVSDYVIFPISYYEAYVNTSSADRLDWTDDVAFAAVVAETPNSSSDGYALYDAIAEENVDTDEFTPTLVLANPIGQMDTQVNINVDLSTRLDDVLDGGIAWLNDELVDVSNFDIITNVATIVRGVLDTLPREHDQGDKLYVYSSTEATYDPEQRVSGEVVEYKLLTQTDIGQLTEDQAGTVSKLLTDRIRRPYPPGNLSVNGEPLPSAFTGELNLSWSHRDRTQQLAGLNSFLDGNIGPENGVEYNLVIRDQYDDVVVDTTLAGNTYTYSSVSEENDLDEPVHMSTGLFSGPEFANNTTLYFSRVVADNPEILIPFDEISYSNGQTINDSGSVSTSPVAFNVSSVPSIIPGYPGNACLFNGTNSYVTCDASSIINSDEIVVECTFQPRGSISTGRILALGSDIGGDRSKFKFDLTLLPEATLRFIASNGSNIDLLASSVTIELNKTYHVLVIVTNTTLRIFVNGKRDILTRTFTGLNSSDNGPLQIGRDNDDGSGTDYFQGVVDHVVVYGQALVHSDIAGHYLAYRINEYGDSHNSEITSQDPEPWIYLTMDDDLVGKSLSEEIEQLGQMNGFIYAENFDGVGQTANASLAPSGKGSSFRFNGSDTYISGLGVLVNSRQTFTLELLIQPDIINTYNILIGRGDDLFGPSSAYSFVLAIYNSRILFKVSNGTSSFEITAPEVLTVGTTYHVMAGLDGVNARVSVNGVSNQINTTIVGSNQVGDVSIGRDPNDGSPRFYYDGYMDRLVMHKQLFSASEMTDRYNSLTQVVNSSSRLLNNSLRITLESTRDGRESWKSYDQTFVRDGYGYRYGEYYGGH